MQKIVTVLGARPQFIKAAAVSRAIATHNAAADPASRIAEIVVHTGQHFDPNMSDIFFRDLGMERPAYELDIHGGNHGEMTGRMLAEVEKILIRERPQWVLVYGDTNSTLAGALAAAKLHIPVAHVEAGLRSFNMRMPEEINRILTDRVSSVLFCPTDSAVANLEKEGVTGEGSPRVVNCGDVMYDVALYHGRQVDASGGILGALGLSHGVREGGYCLSTIHRAENTDHPERLKNVFDALLAFSEEIPVVLPLHPRTRKILEGAGSLGLKGSRTLVVIDPVGYLDMVQLEKHAALVATDSGGVQKEAFFYRVPCVTLRDETEWVELVESGWNRLAPPASADAVLAALRAGLGSVGAEVAPYGKGDAADRIVASLAGSPRA